MESTNEQSSASAEVKSTANHIQLLKWVPEEFAGIDSSRNFVFYLNEAPIIGFEGDQGVAKTSLLNCLIAHLGGEEAPNSLHITDLPEGKKQVGRKSTLTFKDKRYENISYEVRIGKSSIIVKKMEDVEGTVITSSVDKPKSFLYDMFGPIGISPMSLKENNGKKQIEWVRSLYKFTPAQEKEEQVIQTQYKQKFQQRTGVNNDVKRIKQEIINLGYYKFDSENSCFISNDVLQKDLEFVKKNDLNEDEIKKKFETATENNRKLTEATTRLETRNREKENIEKEIADLKRQLDLKVIELEQKSTQIVTGKQYVEEYKNAPVELEQVRVLMENVGEVKLKRQNIATAKAKVDEYQKQEDEQVKLNGDLDELKIRKKNFIKQFTPDVPGIELVVNDGIDNDREEGIYYNNRTPQELSESEIWDFFMQICHAVGIHFMFIENMNSLGSAAVERINWFVQNGYGQVFYTAMQRGQKEMKLTMHTQL